LDDAFIVARSPTESIERLVTMSDDDEQYASSDGEEMYSEDGQGA